MYRSFQYYKSIKKDSFVFNLYSYNGVDSIIDEKGLSKFIIRNVLNNLTKYNIDKPIIASSLKNIILKRIDNYGLKSGYLGVDSELFFVGFLKETEQHKILTRNNSLEKADFGKDIISLFNDKLCFGEVKSSIQSNKNINKKLILEAIESMLTKQSVSGDQSIEIMEIVNESDFNKTERENVTNFIENILEGNVDYEDNMIDWFIRGEAALNILLLTKFKVKETDLIDNLESNLIDRYQMKHGFDSNKVPDRISKFVKTGLLDNEVNIYQISITENFSIILYLESLVRELKTYE